MKKYLFLILIIGLFISDAPTASACSPAPGWPPSAQQNLNQKDIAFIGTVKSIVQDKSVNGDYRITFTVNETYKGSVPQTVIVRTTSSSAACGYDDGYTSFKAGTVWAIYANKDEGGSYTTNSLSLNTKYGSVALATTALLGFGFSPINAVQEPVMCTMQYAPVCGTGPDGTVKTYGNACVAGGEKATVLYEGECKDTTTPTSGTKPVVTPKPTSTTVDTDIDANTETTATTPVKLNFWQKLGIKIKAIFSF